MRAKILELLRAGSGGGYISGEEVSQRLAVSRTAIWKHIQALKADGYDIEAHSRLGYRLRGTPDLLLPGEIDSRLTTKVFGRHICYFPKRGLNQYRGEAAGDRRVPGRPYRGDRGTDRRQRALVAGLVFAFWQRDLALAGAEASL